MRLVRCKIQNFSYQGLDPIPSSLGPSCLGDFFPSKPRPPWQKASCALDYPAELGDNGDEYAFTSRR